MNLRFRRITIFFIICIVIIAGVSITSDVFSGRLVTRYALSELTTYTEKDALRLNEWFDSQTVFISTLASDIRFASNREIQSILRLHAKNNPKYNALAYARTDGSSFFSYENWQPYDKGWVQQNREWYRGAVDKMGHTYTSSPFREPINRRLCISISRSVNSNSGALIGVVSVSLYIDTLQDIANSIGYGEKGFAIITKSSGEILAHPQSKYRPHEEKDFSILSQIGDGVLAPLQHISAPTKLRSTDGIDYYFAAADVDLIGWKLYTAIPADLIMGPIMHHVIINVMISVMLILLISLFIYLQLKSLKNLAKRSTEASEMKNNFIATMSHEIRTPLNTIIGLSELTLSGEKLPLKTYENIEKIYSAGATLLHIVNDILDISKVESGKFELVPAEYEVASLINDTIMLNILRINDKPIEFIVNVDEVLPLKLLGDEIRVKQIFNNLLSNAFKYTENGVVEWSITFSRDGSDVWIISKVRDTGIGIHNEDIETLFSNYRRLDMKRNRSTEGTGLGLAIAQQMAEMMDGSISVESSYGGGSTFTLRIRQGFAGSTPIGAKTVDNLKNFTYTDKKRDRKTRLFRSQLPHARVLIVDDVQTNLDVSKGMMELYGMTVDCVTNGQASIDLIRKGEKRYDAIFMDHMMPGMDGIEAMKRIRQIGTDYAQSIPIIALTANAIAGNDVLFIKEGFQAFLSKPIDTTTLDNIIKRWIGNGSMSNSQSEPKNGMFDGISINGLDIDKGLSRFDDNNIMYLKVIKSYSHNTKQLLQKIIAFSENIENNIDEYIITIHGIKGSSYNIFANTIGKKAEELEKAARTRDLQFIAENNGELAKLMQNLINDIEAFTDNVELDIPEKESPDSELLRQLKEECAKFNMDGVNNIMKELEKYKYTQGQELTTWLREQVTLMEFSKIINRLSEGEG